MKTLVKVNIFGIAASPRHGNTEILVKEALRSAEELPDVETEFYTMTGKRVDPCDSCYKCINAPRDNPCPSIKDDFDEIWPKLIKADGYIIGVPVYYGRITAQLAALMDRSMALELSKLGPFGIRNKVCGAVTVAFDRQGGHEGTIMDIIRFCLIQDLIFVSVGPDRPKIGIGGYYGAMAIQCWHPDEPEPLWKENSSEELNSVKKDKIGMNSARLVGKRVAEMAKVIKAGFEVVPKNETHWPKGPAGGY